MCFFSFGSREPKVWSSATAFLLGVVLDDQKHVPRQPRTNCRSRFSRGPDFWFKMAACQQVEAAISNAIHENNLNFMLWFVIYFVVIQLSVQVRGILHHWSEVGKWRQKHTSGETQKCFFSRPETCFWSWSTRNMFHVNQTLTKTHPWWNSRLLIWHFWSISNVKHV